MCFTDAFWAEHSERSDDRQIITEEYGHFSLGDEDAYPKRGPGRGFDGAKFRITFNDGRVVWTTNLWSQGTVPEHWHDRFTSNAEVISEWSLRTVMENT
jgi:hypothetical protein